MISDSTTTAGVHYVWPSYPRPTGACPGCGRCQHCGHPAPQIYPGPVCVSPQTVWAGDMHGNTTSTSNASFS
jgi:hypothetical protein